MPLPSFMSADPAEAEDLSAAPAQAPAAAQDEQDQQHQDPDLQPAGEAAPAAPAEAAPAAPAPAAPSGEQPAGAPPGFVPIATFLDMRDKLKDAEKRIPQPQQPQADPAPDKFDDPDGYEAWQNRQIDERIQGEQRQRNLDKLNFSERLVRMEEKDDEAVDKAKKWAFDLSQRNPAFRQTIIGHPDPYRFIMAEHRQAQVLEAVKDPSQYAAFQAWQAAQAQGGQPAPAGAAPPNPAAPAATPQNPVPPRPSIAGAPSAAGPSVTVARGGEATYQRMFGS